MRSGASLWVALALRWHWRWGFSHGQGEEDARESSVKFVVHMLAAKPEADEGVSFGLGEVRVGVEAVPRMQS